MAIEWEQDWHMNIDEVRAKHGIAPFAGSFPRLAEQAESSVLIHAGRLRCRMFCCSRLSW